MLDKYRPRFDTLSPEQTAHLATAVARRHNLPEVPDSHNLYEACESAGLDQADVVMSLSQDATPMGIAIIETMVGHVIVRERTEELRPRRQRQPRQLKRDTRVIATVAPNPKRPGSKSHARYTLYEVGATVEDLISRGLTAGDIRHDLSHGFITVGDKS